MVKHLGPFASPAGLGGGSNVGHNTPSHPSAFGRGFALALSMTPGVPTDIASDRWGLNNTVAFGPPTKGWGPNFIKWPGVVPQEAYNITFKCPCVTVYDPFRGDRVGGVPASEAKTLVRGVVDQTQFDKLGFTGAGTTSFTIEVNDMGAVWGQSEGFLISDRGVPPLNVVGARCRLAALPIAMARSRRGAMIWSRSLQETAPHVS